MIRSLDLSGAVKCLHPYRMARSLDLSGAFMSKNSHERLEARIVMSLTPSGAVRSDQEPDSIRSSQEGWRFIPKA